jgi:hypothetical protein
MLKRLKKKLGHIKPMRHNREISFRKYQAHNILPKTIFPFVISGFLPCYEIVDLFYAAFSTGEL